MRKHSKNSSKELMSSSQDSLSERQPVPYSFKEISLKEGIASNDTYSHEIDKSSEMTVSSFGDFAYSLKLAGLIDRRVNTCVGNNGLMGREVCNIAYFSQESSSCSVTNTINGSNDFYFLNCNGFTEIREDVCYLIKLLHQVKEHGYLLRQDKLLSKAIRSDRVFVSLDNIISADGHLSASTSAVNRLCNNLSFGGSNKAYRRKLFEKQQHGCSEGITYRFQFGEDALKYPLNLVFSRSDIMGDSLTLSGNIPEISGVLRDGELFNGILVSEDEFCDSKGIFLISLVLRRESLAKLEIRRGLMTTVLIPLSERKEKRLIW